MPWAKAGKARARTTANATNVGEMGTMSEIARRLCLFPRSYAAAATGRATTRMSVRLPTHSSKEVERAGVAGARHRGKAKAGEKVGKPKEKEKEAKERVKEAAKDCMSLIS